MRLEPYLLLLMPLLRDHYYYSNSIPVHQPRTGQPALSLKYGSIYVTAPGYIGQLLALKLGLLLAYGTGSPGSIESTGSTSVSGFLTGNNIFLTVDVAGSLGVPSHYPRCCLRFHILKLSQPLAPPLRTST